MTLVDDRVAVDGEAIRVLFKEARRRRRRRWIIVALVLTVALITFAALTLPRSRSANTPAGHKTGPRAERTTSAMPGEIVTYGNDSSLEVLSSRDGHVIRTLARHVGTFRGPISLSVSPTGTVYFDNLGSVHPWPLTAIYSVPVTGGPVRYVANGSSQAVSPNGRFLAYTSTSWPPSPTKIVVEDLRSHAIRSWTDNVGSDPESLSWSPDSRFVSFTEAGWGRDPPNPPVDATYWALDTTAPGKGLGPARRLTLTPDVSWAGFMPESPNGTLLGVGVTSRHNAVSLVAVDARSGQASSPSPARSQPATLSMDPRA
jgi:hypothetical protein